MEIETTPWHETRSLISPQIEMLHKEGVIKYKKSFLKTESPQTAILKSRFIVYDRNYVKYCFLKEFYQILFDGIEDEGKEIIALFNEAVTEFIEYRKQSQEPDSREVFRAFCKAHLFK